MDGVFEEAAGLTMSDADKKRRRSVENTRVRAARIWMYQQRRAAAYKSRGTVNRSVIVLPSGVRYHATKGYRFQ